MISGCGLVRSSLNAFNKREKTLIIYRLSVDRKPCVDSRRGRNRIQSMDHCVRGRVLARILVSVRGRVLAHIQLRYGDALRNRLKER